jgi:hypothetical protein
MEKINNIGMTIVNKRLFMFPPCWRSNPAPSARIGPGPSVVDYSLFAIGEQRSFLAIFAIS